MTHSSRLHVTNAKTGLCCFPLPAYPRHELHLGQQGFHEEDELTTGVLCGLLVRALSRNVMLVLITRLSGDAGGDSSANLSQGMKRHISTTRARAAYGTGTPTGYASPFVSPTDAVFSDRTFVQLSVQSLPLYFAVEYIM